MKSKNSRCLAICLGAVLLSLAGMSIAASSGWLVISSPNPGSTNFVYSVDAVSDSDVWSVGYDYDANSSQFTITQHWDGSAWKMIPSPSPGTTTKCGTGYSGNMLNGVAAVSTSDVWAVGEMCGYGNMQTLTEHWNGSKWQVVFSPRLDRDDSTLVAVAAASSNDVWAVGNYQVQSVYQWNTLIEHWDGVKWRIVSSPNVSGADKNFLNAVAVVSPTDVWTVGYSEGTASGTDVPLVEHYDGQSWSIVVSPFPKPSQFNALYGVTALASNNVWAVGYANENSKGQNGEALIEHWDGAQWRLVDSPIAGAATILSSVAAVSSSEIWAVGYIQTPTVQFTPVTEQWNGTSWSVVTPPNPGKVAQLFGVSSANGKVRAVGAYSTSPMTQGYMESPRTLIMQR